VPTTAPSSAIVGYRGERDSERVRSSRRTLRRPPVTPSWR